MRASLDGSERTVLIETSGRPHGLTIDYTENRIYWTNMDEKLIESCDLHGKNNRSLVKDGIVEPSSLTQYEDFIYWTGE
jgi:low density lipoprotein receptor-related protein 5/6